MRLALLATIVATLAFLGLFLSTEARSSCSTNNGSSVYFICSGSSSGYNATGGVVSPSPTPDPPADSPLTLLTNVTLWYDLQDATKVTLAGSKVSGLTDKSTAANDASQGTDANRPTYNATGINGHPSMNGDSATGLGLSMTATAIRIPSSVFVVLQKSNDDARGMIIGKSGNVYSAIYAVSTFMYSYALSTVGEIQSTTGVTNGVGAIAEWDLSTSNGANRMFINNSELTITTNQAWPSGSQAGYTYLLGGVGARDFKGEVGEVIVSDFVSSTERTNIYNYLKAKWGTP